ncbi:metalloregulator ArsR/SmtB family transcription factor [Pseudarthrobacter sp. NIBRBAC000502772]|uniref:ArsR/SmtB family transcription factor n=1 Tax=Pseudarthrobacter sp. NIBRBAC000502772 TaxID=2590775 RepID=UPI001131F0CB|nr:metalloregulator ArsR/SmtB family transcription factor [Pseudarthrobacter sp. NIBRBAC000502772]QDG66794.1 metalloregulator ArsR/SmtB family transcription factor [Pseudarthrobacter sp. NIBRBAC000502772]
MESWNKSPAGGEKLEVFDQLARVAKAMSNGKRLELIELLAQGEHPVEEIAAKLGMGVTTVSAHLQQLKQAGLVDTRRVRTSILYRLAGDDVAAMYLAIKRVGMLRSPALREALASYLSPRGSEPASTIDPAAVTSEMTVIDVRPRSEYDTAHFPGAVSIPLAELAERYGEIPSGNPVVVYCRGEFCKLARDAAAWLSARGIPAMAMDEGVIEWRATHLVDLDATA